jgi:MFS family permease
MRHEHSLDALNFFLADVRQGLGPYLAIYLLTERHWAEDRIGFVMTIATVCGLVVQTPAGALTDVSHAKRAIVAAAALVVTGASILLPFLSSFVFVAGSQAAADAAAAFFGPAIAAITLGIMGPRAFTRRIGRNESFNHAGNAFAAALAGVCAWMWGPLVVFYLIASMALLSIVSVLTIRAEAIDNNLSRGLHDGLSESQEKPSGLGVLMGSRGLLIFCLCCVIFHLANAAMLPLVGQKLALRDENEGTALMSGCIVEGQDAALLGVRQVLHVEDRPFSIRGGERAVGSVHVDLDAKNLNRAHLCRPLEKFLHGKVKTTEIQQDDGKYNKAEGDLQCCFDIIQGF